MKSIALFFTLVAAAAASGYVPGREYVYRYRGQVSAGFPDKKPQYSGLVYETLLHIQPKGGYAIMQFEGDKKYSTFNAETTKYTKHPLKYEDLPPRTDYNTPPFKVHFKDGKVTQFQVHKDEPAFSVNLKRALISMFQLTFDPAEPQNLSDRDNEAYKPDYGEHYYKIMEDGLLGQCETQYVIEHLPNHQTPHNNIVLNITKTRNYHKCNSVPNHYYSTFYGEECGHVEEDKAHTIHGNAFYHYDIRGDRHHYVIEKATVEGDFGFTPYPLEGQTAEIFVNRSLELIEEHDSVQKEYEVNDADLKTYTSLEYEFEYKPKFRDQVDLKKPHYLFHIYRKKVPLDQIRKQVADLVKLYDDDTYKKNAKEVDKPAMFLELVRSISTLDYDDLSTIYKEYSDFPRDQLTPERFLTKNLIFDALSNSGTNPALLLGKNLVKSGKVPDTNVLHFLQQVPTHVKEVTQTLLDEFYELCRDDHVVSKPKLYAACYLTIANIIHDRCVARYHPEGAVPKDDYSCPDEVPVNFFQEISRKYEDSDDEYRKIAYISALGRLGVKESLRYLRHYVEGDAHQNLLDRTNAIYALGTIARRYPEMVRELIVPLYYNTSENYIIRIAAFNMLMMTHPHLYELETIARNLVEDKDDQVRSYVYSAFRSYDNSTHPCDHQIAHDVRYALAIIKPYRKDFDKYDYSYSHHHYMSGFNEDYGYGGFTRFAYVASDTGYIPRNLYLQFNDVLRGKSFNSFSVGMRQYGLEKFADRLFGPEGAYGKRSLFDLFKKRKARDVSNVEKERREIKEKLNLQTRDYGHVDGEIFINCMGSHISFYYFNESSFEGLLKDGQIEIPDLPAKYKNVPKYKYQRFMMPLDLVYLIPSEIGLPILMDFKQPMYFYHKNDKLQLEVKPAFFREDRQGQAPSAVTLNVEGHVIMDKQFIGTIGVVQPLDHTVIGAGIERRSLLSLPINLHLGYDLNKHELDVLWKPVIPHQVYHFEYEPYTFIDSWDDSLAVVEEKEYKPVRRIHYKHKEEKHLHLAPFGLNLHVNKDTDSEWSDYGSLWRFLFRKDYREKFYYMATNPQFEPLKYDFVLENAEGNHVTEVAGKFSYNVHRDETKRSPVFSENGFEEYGRSRSDKNLLTRVLHGEILAKGTANKDRSMLAELTYSRDLFRRYHKAHLYYYRTPFFKGETDDLKACVSGYFKYPKFDVEKLAHLDTLDLDVALDTEIKAHFGKDCNSHQKVIIKGRFDKTEEQRELERERDQPEINHEHDNPYQYLYQKCVSQQQDGDEYPDSCIEYMLQSVKLNKYTFDVKYENLSPRFLNMTYKFARYLKHELYDHADINTIDVNNPEGEYHVDVNVSAIYQVADIRVKRPHSETNYNHVYVPHFKSWSAYPIYEDVLIKKSLTETYCKVMGDKVFTFDRYAYTLPPIDCWKIISKDCSPMESFIVLGTKIQHPKYKKAVKTLIGKHKVEMLPISDDSDIIIRVDGKKVPVTENEPYFHYEKENVDPIFHVARKDFYYALRSEQYGLIVEYDGSFIAVEVSPYYRAKLCGLCGNYNGQKYDGYQDENGCLIEDDKSFAYSWAIPSESCTAVPKVDHPCYGEGGAGCTELKTQVLQINKGKMPQTCFSTEPIPKCRTGCESQRHFNRKLSYHCLPAKDDSTKNLMAQAETRVLHEVKRKSRDHEEEVEVQEGCHRP